MYVDLQHLTLRFVGKRDGLSRAPVMLGVRSFDPEVA